jgi:lipopolysaccharide/colanic/teichoic acid biosynthesis glycosyltransferase
MYANAETQGRQITVGDDPRITRVGRVLRRFKVDELPQLINVVKGEMSLVGPRPEVPDYVAHYTPEQRCVLDIMPGITDPASMEYRRENEILASVQDPDWTYVFVIMPEKIRLNIEYARSASVWTDLLVILRTLWLVLKDRISDPRISR